MFIALTPSFSLIYGHIWGAKSPEDRKYTESYITIHCQQTFCKSKFTLSS